MIRTVEEFYGRQRELQHVMARIGAQTPQSISLVGERRMGKSSLLWHLSQREIYASHLETPERYVFMLMDCQGQQHLNQEGFCRAFGEHLGTAVGDRLEVAEVGDLSGVERVAQAMEGADLRLVCLFDEFETITRNADFGTEFFGFLRSMANAYPVAFVTASRSNLETLCHNREISESPFFNIFSHIRMGPMSEVEVRELITKPSAEAGMPSISRNWGATCRSSCRSPVRRSLIARWRVRVASWTGNWWSSVFSKSRAAISTIRGCLWR